MSKIQHDPPDEIRDLIVEAGPQDPIPAEDLAAIRAAARKALTARSDAPVFEGQSVTPIVEGQSVTPIVERRPSYRRPLALAATLAMAAIAVWLFVSTGRSPVTGATVATVELVRGASGSALGLEPGAEITAGSEIDTGATDPVMVALRMSSGHSVRLHADSRVRVDSATRLELERGTLYVDSGADGSSVGLEIATPLGIVRELGTQYEVRVGNGGQTTLRVRVREGSVTVSRNGESHSASRGEQLTVDASGNVSRRGVPIAGDVWVWVTATAPSIDLDGKTLAEFLDWFGRESGLEIVFESPSLEIDAQEVAFVGEPAAGLTPEETLDVALSGFGLGYRLSDEALVVTGPEGL